MIRRDKFALACLMLSLIAGLVGLSSCGGGGGGSRGPGDQTIITPPGNRAPVVVQALENVVLPPSSGQSRWESQPLGTYFSDPDGDPLEFSAQVEDSNVASVEISNAGSLILHVQETATATITVTAQDSGGLTATQRFTVTVGDRSALPADRHSDTPAAATDIVIGRAVEGNINSPEDVDHFRFSPPDSGIYRISLDSNIPGVGLDLLDDGGNVIATDQTASPATLIVMASVGLGVIAFMNADYKHWYDTGGATGGTLPTPGGLIENLILLGVETVFGNIVTKKVLLRVTCHSEYCKQAVGIAVGQGVGYIFKIGKRASVSKQEEEFVFLRTQNGEGCKAQVTFNEQGFFTPSRYFSTQFGTSRYSGACRNGRAHGQGAYTASNTGRSLTYTGAWADGEPRGLGDWHISDSNFGVLRYNGEWQSGQPNGQGTGIIEFNNGNDWRYTGAWVRGNPHGRGTWSALTNGDRYHYVGEFRNGLQHGQGTETNTYANGDRERLVGEFLNDDLWNGTATWNGVSCRVANGVDQC